MAPSACRAADCRCVAGHLSARAGTALRAADPHAPLPRPLKSRRRRSWGASPSRCTRRRQAARTRSALRPPPRAPAVARARPPARSRRAARCARTGRAVRTRTLCCGRPAAFAAPSRAPCAPCFRAAAVAPGVSKARSHAPCRQRALSRPVCAHKGAPQASALPSGLRRKPIPRPSCVCKARPRSTRRAASKAPAQCCARVAHPACRIREEPARVRSHITSKRVSFR